MKSKERKPTKEQDCSVSLVSDLSSFNSHPKELPIVGYLLSHCNK